MPDISGNGAGERIKRIKLELTSQAPQLGGVTALLTELRSVKTELGEIDSLATRVAASLSNAGFQNIGRGAATAAAEIRQVGAALREVNTASSSPANLLSKTQVYASKADYENKKAQFTSETYRNGPGGTLTVAGAEGQEKVYTAKANAEAARKASDAEMERVRRFNNIPAQEAKKAEVEAARQSAEMAKQAEKQAEAARQASVEEAERRNKARALLRERADEREETARRQSIDEAERRNKARDIRRQRAEERQQRQFERDFSGAQDAYADAKSTISTKARTPADRAGLARRQIEELDRYVASLQVLTRSTNLTAEQQAKLASEIRVAQRAINKWSHEESGAGSSRWLDTGLKGFTPGGFTKNALTAGGWMLAVQPFFKAMDLGSYSVERLEKLQSETARLEQIFKGVGGTANQVADDVLKLAAAEGQSTETAMKSAEGWARLGLTRREVGEATRVSLVAANVSGTTAHEATEKLASLMVTYNLRASQLSDTLGLLSRSSQTYRVQTGELLDGLTKVSNIAKEAGMSLAQTQGILAVASSRTGQNPNYIGNTLRTVLGRLVNPDVREFFSTRYNTVLTGGAKDLETIYRLRQQSTPEQRREMDIKVATPYRANSWSAIISDLPTSLKAAADALRHMNAAEEENEKVTSRAAAAGERLKATWDRMINSNTVDSWIARQKNALSGIIAGFTPGPSEAQHSNLFFDPDKATTFGSVAGLANFVSLGLGRQFIRHGFAAVGSSLVRGSTYSQALGVADKKYLEAQGFYDTPQTQEQKMAEWAKRPNRARAEAEALGFDLRAANLLGDKSRIGALEKQQAEAIARAKKAEAEEERNLYVLAAQQTYGSKEQLDTLEQIHRRKQEIARTDQNISERLEGQYEQTKRVMETVSMFQKDLGKVMSGFGLSERATDPVALQGTIDLLEKIKSSTDQNLFGSVVQDIQKQIDVLRQQADWFKNPAGQMFTNAISDTNIAGRLARSEIGTYGTGLTEGERLLDQRQRIGSELKSLSNTSAERPLTNAELVRQSELLAANLNTQLSVTERIAKVEQERKQVAIESRREFERSLITAGPGEILRKLAAFQLGGKDGRNFNAGSFFAMSPEMRGDAYTMMGGDRMAMLNREAGALRGQGRSVDDLQRMGRITEASMGSVAADIAKNYGVAIDAAAKLQNCMSNAASSAAQIEQGMDRASSILAATLAKLGGFTPQYTAPSAPPVAQAQTHQQYSEPAGPPVPGIPGFKRVDF